MGKVQLVHRRVLKTDALEALFKRVEELEKKLGKT